MNMDPDTLFQYARKIHQAGHPDAAAIGYKDLLEVAPDYPHANYLNAVALVAVSRADEALPFAQAHLKERSDHAPGWVTLGDCFSRQEKIAEAGSAYRHAMHLEPKNADAPVGIGQLLVHDNKWTELYDFASSLIRVHPSSVPALGLLIRALEHREDYKGGIVACANFLACNDFDQDVKLWAADFFVHVLSPDDAVLEAMQAVEAVQFRTLYFRACLRAKRLGDALEVLEKIHQEDPDHNFMTLAFTADALQNAEFFNAAAPYHWEVLAENPQNDDRLKRLIENTLGNAKKNSPEQYADARELAKILVDRSGESIESHSIMASIYMHASRPEMALPYLEYIVDLQPNHPQASPYLFSLNYDERRAPEEVFEAHKAWGRRYEMNFKQLGSFEDLDRTPERRLRIGYLSPDMGIHPVGYFTLNIFEHHNPTEVEVFIYSNRFQEIGDDAISKQFREQVGDDHWRWTRGLATAKLVEMIETDKIDILIDLAGHTGYNRMDALASRAAPLQVSWLGYANTTGLTQVDYRLSDAIVEPEGDADKRSVEKIYRMPNGFHSFKVPENLPEPSPPPCISRGHITFGTYNNMNKLGSRSVELWAKLLKRVPGSKILFKHKSLAVLDNRESLRSLFAMHGIQAQRVILRTTTPDKVDHFKSYKEIDIALDPLAYNGTTTSCDALMMGLPILTLPGRTHASRVTASLLHRVGLDEWVAKDEEDFLRIGAMAAQNVAMLKELRIQLPKRFLESPLSNGPLMAADLEQAYRSIWTDYCALDNSTPLTETTGLESVS